jgi:hypothetical protein
MIAEVTLRLIPAGARRIDMPSGTATTAVPETRNVEAIGRIESEIRKAFDPAGILI